MASNERRHAEEAVAGAFVEEFPALLRYLTSRSGSRSDGEDLAQEVWIKLSRNACHAKDAPLLYLWRIAKTLLIDHARSNRRRLGRADVEMIFDETERTTPEHVAIARDECAVLRAAIQELPARRRAIFAAARLKGERHRSIAARHGVSVRTVELEIQKALDHCAHRLERSGRS